MIHKFPQFVRAELRRMRRIEAISLMELVRRVCERHGITDPDDISELRHIAKQVLETPPRRRRRRQSPMEREQRLETKRI